MSELRYSHEIDRLEFINSFPEGETHDYTARGWGHDYTFEPKDGGMRGRMSGWGSGIKPGDFLLLQNKKLSGVQTTRYQIIKIDYMRDPPDQWFADVMFAPREA